MKKHENFANYLDSVSPGSVFVEIGNERGEGSTSYLCNLARSFSTNLISVDIESLESKKNSLLNKVWQHFYATVRDASWPSDIACIEDLPSDIQHECVNLHKWPEHKQIILEKFTYPDNLIEIQAQGSAWSRNYGINHKQPISLLYLDNFDYIWNTKDMPNFIQSQILDYKINHGIEMNNQNCQIEHLSQLINLYPFMTENCLVGFDDTYQSNGCWIGKSGPGVIFLLSKGWSILYNDLHFVIMGKR